jgi:very-short-patch-repair endonuclease
MSTPTDLASPPSPPAQDFVAAALDKLRLRLLDLTLSNRLLNFKPTRKSSLRVVDELPDVLWNRLQDGDELLFVPVAEPPPDFLVRDETTPGRRDPGRKPTAREYADHLGLATSFDLPLPPAGEAKPKPAHRDKLIQTMHFPDELEAILRSIASSSRSAIEETGSNMLFLVFGFLEWRESPTSATPLLAPLLTLPVSMRRGDVDPKTRTFRYFISYSGEDAGHNASLHEKMRRDFGLQLPVLDDGESPERYFERVQTAIADLKAWRIRRQITLSLLSFGKLLMYQDLDPDRWPAGHAPSTHPLVRELLGGVDRPVGQAAREYDLDAESLRGELPPLVMDADSSQHSALIDAARGRNLVIQGPPGTGKSQTIANLIAATMLAGKTVLFMSEKLAALEVVRRRLDAVGLGAFCLELHSHKTQRQEFLKDIARRLELRGSFPDPVDLDDKRRVLDDARDQLTRYACALHAPFDALKRSAFDLVWRAESLRESLGPLASLAHDRAFPDASAWTLADFERCRTMVSGLGVHVEAARVVAGDGAHPWAGVTRPADDADAERAYLRAVDDVARIAGETATTVASLRSLARLPLDDSRPMLDRFVAGVRSLPPISDLHGPALMRMAAPAARDTVRGFAETLDRWLAARAAIAGRLASVPSDAATLQACRQAASLLVKEATQATTLADVDRVAASLDGLPTRLGACESIRARLAATLGAEVPSSLRGAAAAVECVAAARAAPWASLPLRHPTADPASTEHAYRAAIAEAQAIWESGQALSQHYELSLLPDPATLTRHLGACAAAGPFKFLDAGYQAAKRCHASLAKSPTDIGAAEMARSFQMLASYASRLAAFTQNAEYRAAIGPAFRGMATPFQDLHAVRGWQTRVLASIGAAFPGASSLAVKLAMAPPEVLRQVAEMIPDPDACRAELRDLASAIGGDVADESLTALASAAASRVAALRTATATLLSAGVVPACEVRGLEGLIDAVHAYVNLHRMLQGYDSAKEILGPIFDGAGTSAELVHGLLATDACLRAGALPDEWTAWLRSDDASARWRHLQDFAGRIAALVPRLDAAHAAWMDRAAVEVRTWYAGGVGWIDGASARDVADRARRALAGADHLASWSALLRSRAEVARAGLGFLAELVNTGDLPCDKLWTFCEYGLTARLARLAIEAQPPLASFDGATHGQLCERFRQYDAEVIAAWRARVASVVDRRPVPEGIRTGPVSGHSELALLEHECRKQRRHVPIRQLLRRAGKALQAIKPCFMMGPRSVAQYLEPGAIEFDLLVTDEASQLRPEDAFGAICRVRQAAIIGDPLQLPPTSFFDRMADEEDVDESEATPVDDSESILDVAAAAWSPIRRLRWHYRSRHESLISFSNAEFYEGDLVVFPSPAPLSDDLGVRFELVEDGVYAAGRNEAEARRVVDAIVRHLKERSQLSVGVATMNFKQRDLIDEELQRRAKDDEDLRKALEASLSGHEPLFVKNLENVQGDERDVIIVSVTYGKDANGKLYQRFGPINGAAGPRRLNVLFTRARRCIVVFCSFTPDELTGVDSASPDGAGVLKRYLAFARARASSPHAAADGVSDLDMVLSPALREQGLVTRSQVGMAASPVDLAVALPESPDRFVLGIESDGPRYRAAHSARDRDRLRQQALESMGWTMHRLWTAEWYRDRARVVDGIVRRAKPS